MPQFPRPEALAAPPPLAPRGGPAGRGRERGAGAGRWARGARGAPGPRGRKRRKPGREAGGGAAALSHTGSARPPLPGAEVTAARDGRPQQPAAPRDRWAAESRSGAGRGRAGSSGRGRWAAGGGDPRPDGRAALPGLRHPCPAAAAAPAGSPRGGGQEVRGAGPPRSPVRSGPVRAPPRGERPGGQQSGGCGRGLFKRCQAPGSFPCTALPLGQ